MVTILFHETVFGPINSRRLGTSLGVNLLPNDGKICSFDCIYCEAGFNAQGTGKDGIPRRERVKKLLNAKLKEMSEAGEHLDVITFSGNGEPTLHPHFKEIILDTLMLRDRYFPAVKVSVLSNSTFVNNEKVLDALKKVDFNIMKLDTANPVTMRILNKPTNANMTPDGIIADLKSFGGKLIIQTLFLRGQHEGKSVDNTTEAEVNGLIEAYTEINPSEIQIYSIDRKTPEENIEQISIEKLNEIAAKIREAGFNVQVN